MRAHQSAAQYLMIGRLFRLFLLLALLALLVRYLFSRRQKHSLHFWIRSLAIGLLAAAALAAAWHLWPGAGRP